MKEEQEVNVENQQRERGEALAKAIARKASGKTDQEQQDFYLGLLVELERCANELVAETVKDGA